MDKILKCLGIHIWRYMFSTKFDCSYRECTLTKKQQISGYRGFVDIDYKIY